MLFKKHLAAQVRARRKTQTRRISRIRYREGSIQPIQEDYNHKAVDHIKINRRWDQRLMDVTEEEAIAEGFNNLQEFKETWIKIYGKWDPEQIVTAYEFYLCTTTGKPASSA